MEKFITFVKWNDGEISAKESVDEEGVLRYVEACQAGPISKYRIIKIDNDFAIHPMVRIITPSGYRIVVNTSIDYKWND